MSIERRKSDVLRPTSAPASHASLMPGKRTLTEQVAGQLQMRSDQSVRKSENAAAREESVDPHKHELDHREATHGAMASVTSVSSGDSKLIHRIKVCRNEIGKLSSSLKKYLATPCDETLDSIAFALDSLDGTGEIIEDAKKLGQALDALIGVKPDCHYLKGQVQGIIDKLGDQLIKMEAKLGYCPA